MQIWNQFVAEGHIEWHEEFQRTHIANAGKDRHIMRLAMENRITTSWIIRWEMNIFSATPVSALTVQQRDV